MWAALVAIKKGIGYWSTDKISAAYVTVRDFSSIDLHKREKKNNRNSDNISVYVMFPLALR